MAYILDSRAKHLHKTITMNVKQTFGIILTLLGIGALIYTGVQVMDTGKDQFKILIVTGILGILFFSSGIKLIQATKE